MNRYDTASDIVTKAIRGRGLDVTAAANQAGLDPASLQKWLDGDGPQPELTALAETLGLGAEALGSLSPAFDAVTLPAGIEALVLPFDGETVNAWWIESAGETLLIDAGPDDESLKTALKGRIPQTVIITHTHHDHIGGLPFLEKSGARILKPLEVGFRGIAWGGGRLTAVSLPGHHPEGWGYHFVGPSYSWLATGDAMFAGSMGGCPDPASYRQACCGLGQVLLTIADDVLILPGHGPATRRDIEEVQNPFAPTW